MKATLFVFLMLIGSGAAAQQRFEDFASLRAQRGTYASWALVRYGVTASDKMGGVFFWDSTSVATDDGKRTIGSWTKGRYMKSEPLTQARGTYLISSMVIGQTTFTIPHGLTQIPVNVQYSLKYGSPLALGSSWTADGTNIYITFNTLASLTNLTVAWTAYID